MSDLQWNCHYCLKSIQDGTGYIYINIRNAARYNKAVAQWEAEHPKVNGHRVLTAGVWLSFPEQPAWIITHEACDPEDNDDDYVIEVHRFRTPAQIVHWTAHLMGKSWLMSTDWQGLLEKVPLDRPA